MIVAVVILWLIGLVGWLWYRTAKLEAWAAQAEFRLSTHDHGYESNASRAIADLRHDLEQRIAILEQPKPKNEAARFFVAKDDGLPGRKKRAGV